MVGAALKSAALKVSAGYGYVVSWRALGSPRRGGEAPGYLVDKVRSEVLRAQMALAPGRPLSELAAGPASDTLFILGSGESINELSSADWDVVAAHDVMGLNNSFVHDLVPRFHFLEMTPDPSLHAFFDRCVQRRYRDVEMVFQYKHLVKSGYDLRRYPYPERLWVYTPDKLSTSNPDILRFLLQRFARRHPRWREQRRLVHHNSHVGAAVMFGHALGYRAIVLLGVDLNGGRYFTESEQRSDRYPPTPLHEEMNRIRHAFFLSRGEHELKNHHSMDAALLKKHGSVEMIEAFEIYRQAFPDVPQLYAGSPRSALASIFPVYPFEAHASQVGAV